MKTRAHKHQWTQDGRPEREHHAVCEVCGFGASKRLVVSPSNMVLDRQLSAELLTERRNYRTLYGRR